jgi:hypothetical protein
VVLIVDDPGWNIDDGDLGSRTTGRRLCVGAAESISITFISVSSPGISVILDTVLQLNDVGGGGCGVALVAAFAAT